MRGTFIWIMGILFLVGCGRGSKSVFVPSTSNSLNGNLSPFDPSGQSNQKSTILQSITNNNNGQGTGGYSGALGDITFNYLNSNNASNYPSQLPYRFRFRGPTNILTIECIPYDLDILNSFGQTVGVPSGKSLSVNLSDDGGSAGTSGISMGAFFTDASCKAPAGSVTFAASQSTKRVYYMNATATPSGFARVLTADASYEGNTIIGRFAVKIANNPKFANKVGINFEDWHDYDYNDSVVCLPGTVYYDGSVIRSYGNQTIDFQIFDTTSTSACRHSITVTVTDVDILTNARTIRSRIFVPDDHSAGKSYSIAFSFNSILEVSFYTYPGSICSETEGRNYAIGTKEVRVENVCRDRSGEGQAVN